MTLITEIYQRLAIKHTLYIRLFKERVEIRHLEDGKSIVRSTTKPYSNNRLIIADYISAEEFVKEVIKELLNRRDLLFEKGLRIVLQPVDPEIKEITDSESRIYQDFSHQIGAMEFFLCYHQEFMSDKEILKFISCNFNLNLNSYLFRTFALV